LVEVEKMEITVKGMTCGHCVAAVTKALEELPGVSQVQVDLPTGRVTFASANPIPPEDMARVIKAAGYEFVAV
jgi:copper chaperone